MSDSIINTTTATEPFTALDAEVLTGQGPSSQDIYRERVQVTGASLAEVAKVENVAPGGSDYGLATRQVNTYFDAGNSTTAPLAGGATFTGTGFDVSAYSRIQIFIYAPAALSAGDPDAIFVDWSIDNVNWYSSSLTSISTALSYPGFGTLGVFVKEFVPLAKYVRVNFTANSAGEPNLKISTYYSFSSPMSMLQAALLNTTNPNGSSNSRNSAGLVLGGIDPTGGAFLSGGTYDVPVSRAGANPIWDTYNGIVVKPVGPAVQFAVDATVAASAVNVQLIAANNSRYGAVIRNDSHSMLYVSLGTNATTSSAIIVPPQNVFTVPDTFTGVVNGIWAAAVGNGARISYYTV